MPGSASTDPRATIEDRIRSLAEMQPEAHPTVRRRKKSGLGETRGWILHRAAGPTLAHGHQSVRRPSRFSGGAPATRYQESAWLTSPSQISPSRSGHAPQAQSTEPLTTLPNHDDIQRLGDRGLAPNRR